jgi:putative ABC transport system permease protein
MRFYRALLRLYPGTFHAEYRDELCRAFEERTRRRAGPFGGVAVALAALADVVPNAAAAHADILRQDLGFAARSLRRTPGFALTAVLVAALGVGANTAVFSIADLVFVRPLPFADPERLVKLWQGSPNGTSEVSPANYRDWRAASRSYSGMAAFWRRPMNLVGTGDPRRVELVRATPELLPLLGVAPRIGRAFDAEDAAAGPCIVLSDGLWRSAFGSDPHVVGTSFRLDGVRHTVVGVMPAMFQFPSRSVEAWTSLSLHDDDYRERDDTYLEVLARLRPGVAVERARQELAVVTARLEREYPKENGDVRGVLVPLHDELAGGTRPLVLALCGAGLCILLLACANLAGLFLARGAYRARELAVRAALGAAPERLMRQLVTECLAVACVGGALGVGAAVAGAPLLRRLIPGSLPLPGPVLLDPRVLALALALVLVSGLAFGLAPAVRAGGANGLDALRGGTRATGARTQRLRAGLVVVEVAVSVVLLVMSGLLIRAVWRIQATPPGFLADNVLTLRTALPLPKYLVTARRAQYYDRVLEQVRAIRGVRSAAFATGLPMSMTGGIWSVSLTGGDGAPDRGNTASLRYVTPEFFATLAIPLRRGRDVAATDTREQPNVAVVSESFAAREWPHQDPLGRRFTFALGERTVVGVVGDVRVRGRERQSEPQVYVPYRQVGDSSIIGYTPKDLVVRTRTTLRAGELVPRIRAIIRAVDPEQPISEVRTLTDIVAEETAPRLTQLRLLGAFAAVALLIAGLGIHGLLTFTVAKRTPELGVRLALGAEVREIVQLVLRDGLTLAVVGIAAGVVLAYAAARAMSALLVGVRPEDPLTFSLASGLCLATALVGCLRPALRAARVDPLVALRAE